MESLTPQDDCHPSGCPPTCPERLHLTTRALATLEGARVPTELIDRALRAEVARHARSSASPHRPGRWTPSVTRTLESLGVSAAAIERARDLVESRSTRDRRCLSEGVDQPERVKAWKAANKARVAEHSRNYRQRLKVLK